MLDLHAAAQALPDSVRVMHRLAWVQAKSGQRKVAIVTYRKTLRLDPSNATVAAQLIQLELEAKAFKRAHAVARGILKAKPADGYLLEGDIYRAQGKPRQARKAYLQLLALAKSMPEAQRDAAAVLLAPRFKALGGTPLQQREMMEALQEIAPGNRGVIDEQGRFAMQQLALVAVHGSR